MFEKDLTHKTMKLKELQKQVKTKSDWINEE